MTDKQVAESIAAATKLYGAEGGEVVYSGYREQGTQMVDAGSTQKKRAASAGPTEAQVLKSVLAYLRARPDVAWVCRINSGTFVDGDRFVSANSQRGMSDIIGMMRGGRLFAIEVKSPKGRLLDHQIDFLDMIRAGGGLSGVVRSIDDAKMIIGENYD